MHSRGSNQRRLSVPYAIQSSNQLSHWNHWSRMLKIEYIHTILLNIHKIFAKNIFGIFGVHKKIKKLLILISSWEYRICYNPKSENVGADLQTSYYCLLSFIIAILSYIIVFLLSFSLSQYYRDIRRFNPGSDAVKMVFLDLLLIFKYHWNLMKRKVLVCSKVVWHHSFFVFQSENAFEFGFLKLIKIKIR